MEGVGDERPAEMFFPSGMEGPTKLKWDHVSVSRLLGIPKSASSGPTFCGVTEHRGRSSVSGPSGPGRA